MMIDLLSKLKEPRVVIVANGAFPESVLPLALLRSAIKVVCCDGSAGNLDALNIIPDAIVGDLDSLTPALREKYDDKLYFNPDQECNDLTKAVNWCTERGYTSVYIIGATGLREDHTIGNISLLAEYYPTSDVIMVTDHAILFVTDGDTIQCEKGQKVSLFSASGNSVVTSTGLKYPLKGLMLDRWWKGTLNETTDNYFSITVAGSPVIVGFNY